MTRHIYYGGNTKLCGHESSQRVPTAAAGSGSWKVNEVSVTESGLFRVMWLRTCRAGNV